MPRKARMPRWTWPKRAAEEKPEDDEAKTCPQCGAPVSDDALFCNKCGAQL